MGRALVWRLYGYIWKEYRYCFWEFGPKECWLYFGIFRVFNLQIMTIMLFAVCVSCVLYK